MDEPFRNWYRHRFPAKPEIPPGYVLKVNGALQGHPESPRLWQNLIDDIIQQLELKPCTHEPNLYYCRNYKGTNKTVLFLRQIDDFAISAEDTDTAKDVIQSINNKMKIDVKELGLINRFNGVDVTQTRDFIKLSNATYLKKIFLHHQWLKDEPPLKTYDPLPMLSNPSYQRDLELAKPLSCHEREKVEKEYGFSYRSAIGEIIYALVTCRPDISFPCIKLSQYSARPAQIHFDAIKHLFKYLYATQTDGIYFWRPRPRHDLPPCPDPISHKDNNYDASLSAGRYQTDPRTLIGSADSDYAGDNSHRKSVTGLCLKLAGGPVLYKTHFQSSIALSSTEAEFVAACEAGKYILYLRTILEQIGIPQTEATTLYEDNQGALLMANAKRPTKRTRHVDVKYFVIQQWVENDLLTLEHIATADNYADAITKSLGRNLQYRHMDFIMGKLRPDYASPAQIPLHVHSIICRDLRIIGFK